MKLKDLRKLPFRDWQETSVYNSIIIIPSGRKHDSGWALMYIIGMKGEEPIEIAAQCDSIDWICDSIDWILENQKLPSIVSEIKTDMFYPSGIIRFFSNKYDFEIGISLSSTDIKLINKR